MRRFQRGDSRAGEIQRRVPLLDFGLTVVKYYSTIEHQQLVGGFKHGFYFP